MESQELKEFSELWQKEWKSFREANDKRLDEISKKGDALGLTKEEVEKRSQKLDEMEKKFNEHQKQVNDALAKLTRPGGGTTKEGETKEAEAFAQKAFGNWMRKGESIHPEELKALTEGTGSQGGFTVPKNMADIITEKLVLFDPMRAAGASTFTIDKGFDLDLPVEDGAFAANWVAETAARAESLAGTFTNVNIPAIEMFSNPFATKVMLDDSKFDIESYIAKKIGEQFGKLEGTGFIAGTGSTQPLGIIDAASGISTVDISATGDDLITADGLIELYFAVPSVYRPAASFFLNNNSIKAIRKLKQPFVTSGTTDYLWQAGLAGQPPTLLGQRYFESPAMQDENTNNNRVVAFGNWSYAYAILDKQGIEMLRDPYSNKPHVSFYTTRRVGGKPLVTDAARIGIVTTA